MKASHAVASLVLFAMLIGFVTTFHSGIVSTYGVPQPQPRMIGEVNTSDTIGSRLVEINIFDGLDTITVAFETGASGNLLDLIGSVLLGGIGLIQSIFGVFSAPFEIAGIVECYYDLPPMLLRGLLVIFSVYLAFIIAYIKTGGGGTS